MDLSPIGACGECTRELQRPGRLLFLQLLAFWLAATSSFGAAISYGDFGPVAPGVAFLDVEESSGTDAVPLLGPPSAFATGLDFDPIGFTTTPLGGASDTTEGNLSLTIQAGPGVALTSISSFERGDFTLAGIGTAATSVSFESILQITVTEVDGVSVAPFDLVPVNASASFNLLANPGVVQPWSLGLGANIAAQLPSGQHATEVRITITDTLHSVSELSSVSFGSKKEFQLNIATEIFTADVPETGGTAWLMGGGISLILFGRRMIGAISGPWNLSS
jgi:hypothetical protein